jgi:hypothetical protein
MLAFRAREMPITEKQALIGRVQTLRSSLQREPVSLVVSQALHQCERLEQAILQSHAEGLRFASFTLNRLMQQPGTNLGESSKSAARALKEGLDGAGVLA